MNKQKKTKSKTLDNIHIISNALAAFDMRWSSRWMCVSALCEYNRWWLYTIHILYLWTIPPCILLVRPSAQQRNELIIIFITYACIEMTNNINRRANYQALRSIDVTVLCALCSLIIKGNTNLGKERNQLETFSNAKHTPVRSMTIEIVIRDLVRSMSNSTKKHWFAVYMYVITNEMLTKIQLAAIRKIWFAEALTCLHGHSRWAAVHSYGRMRTYWRTSASAQELTCTCPDDNQMP